MPKTAGRKGAAALKILCALVIVLLDQSLKTWVTHSLSRGQSRPIFPDVLHISLVHNTGTAFGLFQDANLFFIFLSIAVMIYLLFLVRNAAHARQSVHDWLPLILLLGGAGGNLTDRIRLGYVVDFIDIRVWPVFNLADSCISVGIVWLLWKSVLSHEGAE